MITGVAVVPGALALLPSYAGADDVLAELRSAARDAVDDVVCEADRVVLVTATDREPRHTGPSIGRRVGEVLLDGRACSVMEIPWDATVDECLARGAELAEEHAGPTRTALVVVADGSACRSIKAPGHFDERAAGFDDALVAALRQADPAGLTALDPDLGTALLAQGRAPLQVLAGAMGAHVGDGERDENSGHWLCESLEQSDPFGVLYVVARLTRR